VINRSQGIDDGGAGQGAVRDGHGKHQLGRKELLQVGLAPGLELPEGVVHLADADDAVALADDQGFDTDTGLLVDIDQLALARLLGR
jgi:hypothetical protein